MSRSNTPDLIAIESHPALAETASKLFYWAASESDPALYLRQALPLVCQTLGGDYLALVQGEKGHWRTLGASGPQRALPSELLAEALDKDEPVVRGDWYVAPLVPHAGSGELLAAFRTWNSAVERGGTLDTLSQWLAGGLDQVRSRQRDQQRIERLQAILTIAAQWQQTQE